MTEKSALSRLDPRYFLPVSRPVLRCSRQRSWVLACSDAVLPPISDRPMAYDTSTYGGSQSKRLR